MKTIGVTTLLLTLASFGRISAAPAGAASPHPHANETAEQRDARTQWWREARFGMFVHWGLYSGLAGTWQGGKAASRGGMEWIQRLVGVDTHTYAAAAIPKFVPKPGFAAEWARTARRAGCRYVVFTTKHHDGFALHDSKVTNYDALINDRLYGIPNIEKHDAVSRLLDFDLSRGDFTTPEQTVPSRGVPGVDWEQCMTMNTSWGFSEHDHAWKTPRQLIRTLIDVTSKGGNFLLNVGPSGDVSVPPESVGSMAAIGRWMDVNGEAIYGTTASPLPNLPWGRCTKKVSADGATLYLHVFDWPADGKLVVPGLKNPVASATLLAGGADITAASGDQGLTLTLPAATPDADAAVIKLVVTGKLATDPNP